MNTRDKLRQLRESERRNQEAERRYREEQETMEQTPTRYTLTRAERETVIRFDAEERIAHIYTADPVYMRRLDKLTEEDPNTYRCVEVDPLGYFKKYEAPADRIAFRKAPTEARREAGKQRMQELREKLTQ